MNNLQIFKNEEFGEIYQRGGLNAMAYIRGSKTKI